MSESILHPPETQYRTPPDTNQPCDDHMLVINNVSKTFHTGLYALAKTNFILDQGEFVSFVGPSGCGKSTLLRIIAGLLTPTEGSIHCPGLSKEKCSMGFVFQDAHLLPWRTAQRNVELLLEVAGKSKSERQRLSRETLDRVGLKGFEDAYPRQLSGGMKMRVSLARTLVLQPRLFLMDEPFAAVDEMTRHTLNEDFLALQRDAGFSTLFVTHSVSEAVFMSTRVIVMTCRPGRIIADIPIPFDRDRTPELRSSAAFAELCGVVSKTLWEGESTCPAN